MSDEDPEQTPEMDAVQAEFEAAIDLAKKVKEEIESAASRDDVVVRDHLAKDEEDLCGYCGQHFGPDDVVAKKEIYGRKWQFCDEQCYRDFLDASNFKEENTETEKRPD